MPFDYFLITGHKDLVVKADIVLIIKYKNKAIQPGEKYIEHLIVDEETGEECALNVFTELDKVAKRNKIYPHYILNQM